MAINKQLNTKPSEAMGVDLLSSVLTRPGPYIGIIKNNADPTRSGRLQVFITGQGGVESEPSHWVTVRYASPFFGMTTPIRDTSNTPDEWTKVRHTYGMWFTPPDKDNLVLIVFINGDPNQGYWFACINPTLSHSMVPGLAGTPTNKPNLSSDLTSALTGSLYPTVEFNEYKDANKTPQPQNVRKPVHEEQVRILLEQGLEEDNARGVLSSSSQRETPSRVFGISTPGTESGDRNKDTLSPLYRTGGHTFVMDDGDEDGDNKLIRLRTSGGHQVLLNDSDGIIYIGNSNGTAWMEFDSSGKISIYGDNDFSIRSKADINFHADQNINMFAGNNIKIFANETIKTQSKNNSIKATTEYKMYGGKIGIVAGTTLDLQAGSTGTWGANSELIFGAGKIYLNDKGTNAVSNPTDIPINTFKETSKVGKKWLANKTVQSITSTLPTHEPWPDHFIQNETTIKTDSGVAVTTGSGGNLVDSRGKAVVTRTGTGIAEAKGKGVSKKAPATMLTTQPAAEGGVGPLTKDEVTALMTQIAYSESSGNYGAINQLGYIGKYQFGALALIDRGYIKPGTKNSGLIDSANWTGKNGISSRADFLSNVAVQEKVMEENLNANFRRLSKLGTVNSSSPAADVAGLLAASHLLGADGANGWANGFGGADANGTTGDMYFNRGKYSIEVLAKSNVKSTATV